VVSCGGGGLASRCLVCAKLSPSGNAKQLNMTKVKLLQRNGFDGVGSTGKRWPGVTGFCESLINAIAFLASLWKAGMCH